MPPSDTPTALLVDRNRLAGTLDRTQKKADADDTALRPHVKTHTSLATALRQRNRRAVGGPKQASEHCLPLNVQNSTITERNRRFSELQCRGPVLRLSTAIHNS